MYLKYLVPLIMVGGLVACDDTSSSTNNANNANNANNQADAGGDATTHEPTEQVIASQKARVKFKGGERWANQLARGLGIDRAELCKEFGKYDCVDVVHGIALGGVEPYTLRINTPLPSPPLTAPIAVDRVALSACGQRADLDAAAPAGAVVFKEIADAPDEAALQAMGNRLYQQLLSRDAQSEELAELVAFWQDVADAPAPQAEWATMTCYAVATSTEMLFY